MSQVSGHIANRETEAGKEAGLVPASQSQRHIEDRQDPYTGSPLPWKPTRKGLHPAQAAPAGQVSRKDRCCLGQDQGQSEVRSQPGSSELGLGLPLACLEGWFSWMSPTVWGMGGLTQAPGHPCGCSNSSLVPNPCLSA